MRRIVFLSLLLLGLTALLFASGVELIPQEYVLPNGLKILMVVKPGVPRVVCHIYYKVGSINERPGITGIAHLHEHMMFKGTQIMGIKDFAKDDAINKQIDALMEKIYREQYWKKEGGDKDSIDKWKKEYNDLAKSEKQYIIKDDLWETYMRNGGTGLNASTSQEETGYYVTLPSNKIELQMLLEADRMKNAYFREFYSEKDVVMEERRLSENNPGFLFNEQVQATFYTATPYHWEVLGWMDDLKRVMKQDMVEFHNRYYVPNNAVAIYVGDFDPKNVVALATKYFGPIPKGPDNEPIRTSEPAQYSEKRIYGEGFSASNVTMMFHTPASGHKDTYALQILAEALGGGFGGGGGGGGRFGGGGGTDTGRLAKVLVKEKDMAIRASASARPQRYVGAFTINAYPKIMTGVTPEALEKEIWPLLEKIKQEGVTADELQRAKNKAEARFVMAMQNPMFIARQYAGAELDRGWRSLKTDLDELLKVTSDDVKAVAAKYLVKDNSTIAIYNRKMGRQ